MLSGLKNKARQAARRTALGGFGLILALTGLGFLSGAAYMFLLTQTDAITAALVMGGVFMGLGFIFIALASAGQDEEDDRSEAVAKAKLPEAEHSPLTPVAVAFLDGVHQGMAVRRAQRPH